MMKKYNVSITEEMEKKLEEERKRRLLDSIPETVRMILSEYLAKSSA
jgi:Arc/MetJ-type ribon-helix-helix transcriptional regulator